MQERVCVQIVHTHTKIIITAHIHNVLDAGRAVEVAFTFFWKLLQSEIGTDRAYERDIKTELIFCACQSLFWGIFACWKVGTAVIALWAKKGRSSMDEEGTTTFSLV